MRKAIFFFFFVAFLFNFNTVSGQKLSLSRIWETESNVANLQLGEWVHIAGDLNGDGYKDLVAKAVNVSPGYNIYYGSASGIFSTIPNLRLPAGGAIAGYENFGGIGDLNNDGFNDLVIGNPEESTCSIYYGKAAGISSSPDLKIPGSSPTGKMGFSLDISGDLNNDGFDDLVVSEPYVTKPGNPDIYGKLYVFHGSSSGISITPTLEYFTYIGYTRLGTKVRYAGDVENDGYDDLLIGTTDVPSTIGYPYVFYMKGSASGLVTSGAIRWSDLGPLQNDPDYARSIGSAGDLNNDGYKDIFISNTETDGQVKIFMGTSTGPSNNPITLLPPAGTNSASLFGNSVTRLGDFDGDGFNDLAVSLPQYGVAPYLNQGRILVYLGNSTGISSTPYFSYETNIAGSRAAYVSFAGDLNNDGFNDLVAGCPMLTNGETAEGRIMVLKGQSTIYADFTVDKVTDCFQNNVIQFTNTSAPETTSWLWDFGDGTTSTLTSPQHTYASAGRYTISLTVKNTKNHSHTKVSANLIFIQKPLNGGIYTVGAGGSFANIQMLNDSIRCGINGDVTIRFKDGVFDDLLILNNLYKAGTNQKIFFESESGIAGNVIIGNVNISTTDSLVFRNLSFYNQVNSSGIPTLDILNSNDLTFKNCKILHSQNSPYHIRGSGLNRLLLDGNVVSYSPDSTADGSETMLAIFLNNCSNITIQKNTFVMVPGTALYIQNTSNLSIAENLFYGRYQTGNFGNGISLTGANGIKIERNKFFKLREPIAIVNSNGNSNGGYNIIANNILGRGIGGTTSGSATINGIGISGSDNLKIFHNTVYYDQSGTTYGGVNVSCALSVSTCTNMTIRNNILATTNNNNAALSIYPYSNTIVCDNNFISGYIKISDQSYVFPGTYGNLSAWMKLSNLDLNSFEGPVTFDGNMKVTSDPKYINEAGFYINEVPTDLELNTRGPLSADLGAYNISGTPTYYYNSRNLAVSNLSPINVNLGNNFFSIDVTNVKEVAADLIYCSYQVDGGPVVTEAWNTNLAFKNTLTYTFSTPFVLSRERLYKVKAWVSAQVPPTDVHLDNDTTSAEMVIKMKGVYTVYGTNPDYANIATANYHLSKCTANGQVIFNLRPGDQRGIEMFTVEEGQVVYQSETGNANDVKIKLQDIRKNHITLKNLTIYAEVNTETNYDYKGIEMYGVQDITVDSCIIIGVNAARTGFSLCNTTNVRFTNTKFQNLNGGIFFSAIPVFGNIRFSGVNKIINCVFDSVKSPVRIAGRWSYPDSLIIKNNLIKKPDYGIYLYNNDISNVDIEGNRMEGVKQSAIETMSGIYLDNTRIFNNYIESKYLTLVFSGVIKATKIYNNMLIAPTKFISYQINNGKPEQFSIALYTSNSQFSNFEFMNNNCKGGIFAITCTGTFYSYNNNFYSDSSMVLYLVNTSGYTINYSGSNNNYFRKDGGVLGLTNLVDGNMMNVNDVAQFQTLLPNEALAISSNPLYLGPSDLHVQGYGINNKGKDISAYPHLNKDYDKEARNISTPDIGCDEFTPSGPQLSTASISTLAATGVSTTGATTGGSITDDGGDAVTLRGIAWSTFSYPTIKNGYIAAGSGTGSFPVSLSGLTPGTTYYVRAFAKNNIGTVYGQQISFTTAAAPVVVTSPITGISSGTATGGGNVTSTAGTTLTDRGICWSLNANPTLADFTYSNGTGGTGSFTSAISGLSPSTTYYVRAYVTNSDGTVYGNQISFTSGVVVTLPAVTTASVSAITKNAASGGGNVTNNGGGTITDRGICWSTSPNPDTTDFKVSNGTGTGTFTSSLSGLNPNTTYYVRAYATNSAGMAYGNEVSFTTLVSTGQTYIYVKKNATGLNNGTSWTNAFNDLQDAIAASTTGDIIWVAAGTYKPGKASPARTSSFTLKAGVSVYGGFYGNESLLSERNFVSNVTILSGEIGAAGPSDNCYHVITSIANDTTEFLDGFTISDARADQLLYPDHSGGGILLNAGKGLTVRNCIFINNYANQGGAIYAEVGSLNVFNCTFSSNASGGAGAVTGGDCNLKIRNCQFSGNVAGGEGIAILSNKSLNIRECTFSNNNFTKQGGGVIKCYDTYDIRKCTFLNNNAYQGGGIAVGNSAASTMVIDSCIFNGNTVTEYGSAIYATQNMLISNCQFLNNSSYFGAVHSAGGTADTKIVNCEFINNKGYGGGAISNLYTSKLNVKGCKFSYNKSGTGGAILIYDQSRDFVIENCTFLGNKASGRGGAIAVQNSDARILSCTFTKDSSDNYAGALSLEGGNQNLTQCTFSENYSGQDGGAISNVGNSVTIINSTLYNNRSNVATGGGLSNDYSANVVLINSILWHNKAGANTGLTAQIGNSNGASTTSSYSIIDSWNGGGTGNLDSDPWFKDTLTNDLRLYKCSPAINAGTPDTSGSMLPDFDLANQPRILQNRIDIGAYEEPMGNNSAPQITDQAFTVDENIDGIIPIGTISSIDADAPPQSLSYTVNSGNDNNAFRVNSKTGVIELLAKQDYETKNQYNLMITVKDNCTNNILSKDAIITININDLIDLPLISTLPVINITEMDASSGGEQLQDGGGTISEKGVCWNTTGNPTMADDKTTDGAGTGSFTSSITGLSQGTMYYVRAYATNSAGTAYGNEVSFTTTVGTGINSNLFASNISIYPNPTAGQFKIELKSFDASVFGLEIINGQGMILYREDINSYLNDYSKEIDVTSYSNGIYCLQLLTSKGTVTRKLIINK